MRLYLVQHGAALPGEVDPARPLSEAGRRDVQAIAEFLKGAGIRVERVWNSGKSRAEQTAQLLAKAILPRARIEEVGGIGPEMACPALFQTPMSGRRIFWWSGTCRSCRGWSPGWSPMPRSTRSWGMFPGVWSAWNGVTSTGGLCCGCSGRSCWYITDAGVDTRARSCLVFINAK